MPKTKTLWRPKFSIVVTAQQFHDLQELLPWGIKSKVYQAITDDLIRILKSPLRGKFLAAILSRDIHIEDFVKGLED